jgi:glyoxylase-like metal-dependent hydrolase (beta-lactamase superfamily II)
MGKIRIDQYVVGPVQTNCYFAVNTDTKEVLIVDPGDCPGKLTEKLRQEELVPAAILLTHGHFDHAGAARELAEEFHISIYVHEAEQEVLEDPQKNSSWMIGERKTFSADVFLQSEQELDLAGFHIRVLYTPGHTIGGCCYYFPYEDVVFSGDTLFCTSVGRTDLPTGSMSELVRSVREKLMSLPDATTVYPGHGELTTIETERMYNPYL